MPTVTQITPQRRAANRRNVFLDGSFAFGCNLNVIARFRLQEGQKLTAEQVDQIMAGEVRQDCFDAAIRSIESRLHGRAELKKKLVKKEFGEAIIESVLDDLTRMNYIDDAKFAVAKATSAAKTKHHGRRRAQVELTRKGIKPDEAKRALDQVYSAHDSTADALKLAMRQASRLRAMDPAAARRRLIGMLQRRGFDFDAIRPVVEKVLGRDHVDDFLD